METEVKNTKEAQTFRNGNDAENSSRTCILVLGMHRSGTSAITRVLNLMGAALPQNILGASKGNPKGHWEPERIVRYNDKLLRDLNSSWNDFSKLDFNLLNLQEKENYKTELLRLINEEYENSELIVIKDPRICRLAEFYIETLVEANFKVVPILVFRNPKDVVNSLSSRYDKWSRKTKERLSPLKDDAIINELLWLRHTIDAEHSTRLLSRAVLSFELLIDDWFDAIQRIETQSKFKFPNQASSITSLVDEFLSPNIINFRSTKGPLSYNLKGNELLLNTCKALELLCENPSDDIALHTLDTTRNILDRSSPQNFFFAKTLKEKNHTLNELNKETDALRCECNSLFSENKKIEEQLRSKLSLKDKENQKLREKFENLHKTYQNSFSWKITAPLRFLKKRMVDAFILFGVLKRRVKLLGGIRTIILKTISTLKSEGLKGLYIRLKDIYSLSHSEVKSTKNKEPKKQEKQIEQTDLDVLLSSGLFEAEYYQKQTGETYSSSREAITNYMNHSNNFSYNPSSKFSSKAYTQANPDVISQGMPPLFHYLKTTKVPLLKSTDKNKARIAIYTAISGGYDTLNDPLVTANNVDFFVFTDKRHNSTTWRELPFDYWNADPTRTARFYKTHPHLYFEDYDLSIWIDGNLTLCADPNALIESLPQTSKFVSWHHPLRNSLFDEAKECIHRDKDQKGIISNQIKKYQDLDFHEKLELFETSVLIREHNDKKNITAMNTWWKEIDNGSKRDQLSLNYALNKHSIQANFLARQGICMRTDPRFIYHSHKN